MPNNQSDPTGQPSSDPQTLIARLEHLLHGRDEAQLQENLAACETRLYEALAEAARLRAPPEADVRELARNLLLEWMRTRPPGVYQSSIDSTEFKRLIDIVARALTAYGDRRDREATALVVSDFQYVEVAKVARREARAAALDEATRAVDEFMWEGYNWKVHLNRRILALAAAPPQPEGGEG